ncbi:MAG: FumA C-terminus/TtdB family hydratase beta subunit [Bacillota bacterium]|nr:FumA C-terminus/TtdB family hydratase beta subunit [Bacillota bacterium]
MRYTLTTDELKKIKAELRVGDTVFLSGTVYTSRDAAHKRIFELIEKKKILPYEIKDALIYYAGPTQARPGTVIGSCGPTTSGRMDKFAPRLYDLGLLASIGKGVRSPEVIDAIKRNNALYFCAVGGAGALAAQHIVKAEEIAFFDLGCESVKKLYMEKFPLFVAIDTLGNDIYNREVR